MTRRILLSYLSLAAFVLVVLEVPLGLFFADRERERFTNSVASDATVLASLYEDSLDQASTPIDPAPAGSYAATVGARVVVVDDVGLAVVDTGGTVGRDFSTRPEVAEALEGARAQGTRRSETLDTELLYVAVPIASGGVVHGALRITLPTSDVDARVHRFWRGLIGLGVVVLAAVGIVGWTLAASLTRPLRALQADARRFAGGDLSPRPAEPGDPREVRELSEALSSMAADLRAVLDRNRAFVADASHQLRTPLTALRLRLENLESQLGGDGQADLEAAIDEIERLTSLVGQLLALARAEHQRAPVPMDLAALVRERVEVWEAVADASGVALSSSTEPTVVEVPLEPGAIEQVLDNLIDNAISASAPGTAVHVSLELAPAKVVLQVIDHGLGLSDGDKARALDRFWRARSDRSGTGLGLNIVESVVRGHGGTLELIDTPGGGLTVRVIMALDR